MQSHSLDVFGAKREDTLRIFKVFLLLGSHIELVQIRCLDNWGRPGEGDRPFSKAGRFPSSIKYITVYSLDPKNCIEII